MRQQLLMIYGDTFSSAEYIAFADTDTLFVSFVDRDDLFDEKGKPIIRGRIGLPADSFWYNFPNATQWMMGGLPEPMRCMSYFPVIVKRSHLLDMRSHIVEVHSNLTGKTLIFSVSVLIYTPREPWDSSV